MILVIHILVTVALGQATLNQRRFTECPWLRHSREILSSTSNNSFTECRTIDLPQCMNVTLQLSQVEHLANGQIRVGIGYDTGGISDHYVAPDNSSAVCVVCFPLSPQLQQCSRTCHPKGTYRVQNHTLLKLIRGKDNYLAELGDYFMDEHGNAITCNETIQPGKRIRCNYLTLLKDEYHIFNNGTLYWDKYDVTIRHARFSKDSRDQTLQLCYPLDIRALNCDPCRLEKIVFRDFEIQSDHTIAFHYWHYKIDIGQYYYEHSTDLEPYACFPIQSTVAKYFFRDTVLTVTFRTFNIMSAFSLILAIVVQLLATPKFTCYDKCILCHNISVGVFYMNVAICWYSGFCEFSSDVKCSALFVIGYLSQMATYFWLCVCAFHVWQSFMRLRVSETISIIISHKNRFLFYSFFAWGTPTLMCILILVITFSPSLMNSLSLNFHIQCNTWFTDKKSRSIFYTVPIVIITIINIIFFILTIHSIRNTINETKLANRKRKQQL